MIAHSSMYIEVKIFTPNADASVISKTSSAFFDWVLYRPTKISSEPDLGQVVLQEPTLNLSIHRILSTCSMLGELAQVAGNGYTFSEEITR